MENDFRNYAGFVRKCIAVVLVSLVLSAPVVGAYILLLRRTGELVYSGRLARMSYGEQKILWLSGYYDAAHHVKPDVALYFKPKVVVFGSSRVMQIRSLMFKRLPRQEFYNLGGAITSFEDAKATLERLERNQAKPELIVFGVDWWWLQQRAGVDVKKETNLFRFPDGAQKYLGFYLDQAQLIQGTWKDRAFYSAVLNGDRQEQVSGRYLIGMGARKGGGFRNDGSYRYWKIINDPPPLRERRSQAYERFRNGKYRGNEINEKQLADFEQFLALCKTYNIDVIVMLPPLDPVIFTYFRSSPEASDFWEKLPPTLEKISHKYGFQFRDYTQQGPLTTDPREYIDWFHGSDVVYGKLILDLAKHGGTSELLSEYVDTSQLDRDLRNAVSSLDLYGD